MYDQFNYIEVFNLRFIEILIVWPFLTQFFILTDLYGRKMFLIVANVSESNL